MSELPTPARVGVVGAGYFGRFHLDAWSRLPEAELVAVADPDTGRATKALAEMAPGSGAQVFADALEMVETLRPDLVDITAPPAAHLPLLRALAPRVRHIICQKPFCGGLKGARAALELTRETGNSLAVHENIRYQPWNAEAHRLIVEGALGPLFQISFRLRPGDGRGPEAYLARQPYFQTMKRFLVHETAVHWIDTFRFLAGEVMAVTARLHRLNPAISGEDAGIVLFDFVGGTRGLFDGNRLADHASSNPRRTLGEMLIEGERATLRLDGEGRLWLRPFGDSQERPHEFDWADRHFGGDCVYHCCAGILADWQAGRPSPMDAAAYVRNQVVEEAIYESDRTGRTIDV